MSTSSFASATFPIFRGGSFSPSAVAVVHPLNNPGGPVSLNPQPLPPRVYLGGLLTTTMLWR